MKERPILFSGAMVRAILAGKKTQTRRVVTARSWDPNECPRVKLIGVPLIGEQAYFGDTEDGDWLGVSSPYGFASDRLWIRERWGLDHHVRRNFRPLGRHDLSGMDLVDHLHYAATDDDLTVTRWRPSIHMPRWASRLTLEVTNVRVERLQDISEEDAQAEGVDSDGPVGNMRVWQEMGRHRYEFANVWESINSKKHPWDSNPWVWAITFNRVES